MGARDHESNAILGHEFAGVREHFIVSDAYGRVPRLRSDGSGIIGCGYGNPVLINYCPFCGANLRDDRVEIRWHTSEAVEIDDAAAPPDDLARVRIEWDRVAAKAALKEGRTVDGAQLVKRRSLVVR